MQIKEVMKDKVLIEADLYTIRCPYCDTRLRPAKKKKKTCVCNVIAYRFTDKPVDDRYVKTYPVVNGKELELECVNTGQFVEFEILEKQKGITLMVDERVKPSGEKLRELLSLDWEEILQILREDVSVKAEKKTFLYVENLNFEQRIKLLKLANMKILSNAYNKYLLSRR